MHEEFTEKIDPKSDFTPTPTVFFPSDQADNIGAYLVGTYLFSKAHPKANGKLNDKGQPQMNYWVEIRFEASQNIGSITIKDGAKYSSVTPKVGDIVTIYAPGKLYRQLKSLDAGDRFKATYLGLKLPPRGQKGGAAHTFDVRRGNNVLSDEDRTYIEQRTKAKAPETVSVNAEAEAEKAMGELVD